MVATREALSVEPAPARSLTVGDVGADTPPPLENRLQGQKIIRIDKEN